MLTVPTLRQRRSEKWSGHPPGVIGATVAELDFELAAPIAAVLHDTIARSDLGYAHEVTPRLREAFTGFAVRRLGWRVDPDRLTLVPEVLILASPHNPTGRVDLGLEGRLDCAGLDLARIRRGSSWRRQKLPWAPASTTTRPAASGSGSTSAPGPSCSPRSWTGWLEL
jgi:hypothetical protein